MPYYPPASSAFTGGLLTSELGVVAGTAGAPGLYGTGDADTGQWLPGADILAWSTGGTERLRLSSAGLVPAGLFDISAAAAGQIKFPATQNASADANVLDDYEEGTFTPTIAFGGGSTGVTYLVQNGVYTKVGRSLVVNIRIILTSKGSSTGQLSIEGLPFTCNANGNCTVGLVDGLTLVSGPWGLPNNTTTQILVYNGDGTSITQTNMGNGSSIYVSAVYPN